MFDEKTPPWSTLSSSSKASTLNALGLLEMLCDAFRRAALVNQVKKIRMRGTVDKTILPSNVSQPTSCSMYCLFVRAMHAGLMLVLLLKVAVPIFGAAYIHPTVQNPYANSFRMKFIALSPEMTCLIHDSVRSRAKLNETVD